MSVQNAFLSGFCVETKGDVDNGVDYTGCLSSMQNEAYPRLPTATQGLGAGSFRCCNSNSKQFFKRRLPTSSREYLDWLRC